jgi:hypothetical protein
VRPAAARAGRFGDDLQRLGVEDRSQLAGFGVGEMLGDPEGSVTPAGEVLVVAFAV